MTQPLTQPLTRSPTRSLTTGLTDAWHRLGGDPAELDRLTVTGPARTLCSTLPCTAAAVAAAGSSLLAATTGPVELDTRHLSVAVRSERFLRRDGAAPGSPFDPLSAFHRAADGWIRLHANYPWHRAAALRVLSCTDDLHAVRRAIASRSAAELETTLHESGGVAAACRTEEEWRTARLGVGNSSTRGDGGGRLPLVERYDLAPAAPRPRRDRLRVLDLTRVIAGPVATRTLAVHGADVLRLDPPGLPEIPLQAWDMLPGKRSALLDAADRATLEELLAGADVVVTGYRPGALDRFGLAPGQLAQRHPGRTVVTLSAWGYEGAWANRRGFDSIVQAACGIAVREAGPDWTGATAPGALPAQLLDHATGYLAAAATLLAVADQRTHGGTPHVRLSLLGTADWLLGLPAEQPDDVADVDPGPYLHDLDDADGRLTLVTPPGTVDGRALRWGPPAPAFGAALPRWAT